MATLEGLRLNAWHVIFITLKPMNERAFVPQEFGCLGSECQSPTEHPPVVPYRPTPPTPRVVQAVFSFGAALTQLLDHLCPHAKGVMCPGLAK